MKGMTDQMNKFKEGITQELEATIDGVG